MHSKIIWLLEGQIIFAKYAQIHTYEELEAISDAVTHLLDESQASAVHIIDDLSLVDKLPKLTDVQKNVRYLRHKRLGWYVTTMELPPLVKMISNLVISMMKFRYRGLLSPEDALRFLTQVDSTLPDADTLIRLYYEKVVHLEQADTARHT